LPAVTVRAQCLDGRVGAHRFVAIEQRRVALLLRDRHRQHFVLELAGTVRRRGALVTLHRKRVLLLARDFVALGDAFTGVAHVPRLERTPQTVVDHRVHNRAVAHAQAFADARQ
jgi:hypothetical protein